jgi:hypothetical protein
VTEDRVTMNALTKLPRYSQLERDELTAEEGDLIYNTFAKHVQVFNGIHWLSMSTWNELGAWEDLIGKFTIEESKAGNKPATVQDSDDFTVLEFSVGDVVTVNYHVLHDYKILPSGIGSDAFIHVHWYPVTGMTIGETVTWRLTWKTARGHQQGESLLGTTTGHDLVYTADKTIVAGEHMITEANAVPVIMKEADSMLMVRYELLSKTTASNIIGMQADLHYQSTNDSTLNKEPPFYY